MMPRYAVIEIGTNSIKFHISEVKDKSATTIIDTNDITRLGEGLQKTGKICDAAIQRNFESLQRFKNIVSENRVDQLFVVGTMGLRFASNAKEFISLVKKEVGLNIEVLSGKEEARLSYLAIASDPAMQAENILIFDTGGGSTELIFGNSSKITKRFSLNIGAVQPTEKFLHCDPVTITELFEMLEFLNSEFSKSKLDLAVDKIIGIGGSVTTMAAISKKMDKFDGNKIHNSKITLEEVERQIKLFSNLTIEQRKSITGLPPKRADVILGGVGIINSIMNVYNKHEITVSNRGLRHGLIYDRVICRSKGEY